MPAGIMHPCPSHFAASQMPNKRGRHQESVEYFSPENVVVTLFILSKRVSTLFAIAHSEFQHHFGQRMLADAQALNLQGKVKLAA